MRYLGDIKNDTDLLIKMGRHNSILSGYFDNCPLCFPLYEYYERKNCISCSSINNLIKCYHKTIRGKCIIYICDNDYCYFRFYNDMIKPKNDIDMIRIDNNRFLVKMWT